MDQSGMDEQKYGMCIECKQMSMLLCASILGSSILCQTCDSNLRVQKFGRCIECKQENTGHNWCQTCNSKRFQQNFSNWTSGNDDIDRFIQNTQLSAWDSYQILEWIPYDRFTKVKYIAKGGFGKVYRATWKDGNIFHWDVSKCQWKRLGQRNNTFVALKSLNKSQKITYEFINEITSHIKVFSYKPLDQIIRCYGITQDSDTKDYIMVMQYANRGSLRNYLNEKKEKVYNEYKKHKFYETNLDLDLQIWGYRIGILRNISIGLGRIHDKELIHRDLHSGNIVCNKDLSRITDMGLCRPANHEELENMENSVYGVLPYLAPEILRGQDYTKATDTYSFGIIMYEVISELPPYYDIDHDEYLVLKICDGLRPRFNFKVPQLILHLVKRCLDANPSNRPSANDLTRMFCEWKEDLNKYVKNRNYDETELLDLELVKQIKEISISNSLLDTNNLPLTNKTHPGAIYTSRLFNCNNNLPEPKNSGDYYENYDNISSVEYSDHRSNKSECLECEIID
ncbi:kinase-like domain-containing protein [Rhizophagus clarus]|uniref:Kinase-like domain-containing protein n=1 Tax=Rhizophagus clarus TaxID=94130 RepID=A0A8H3KUS9_9GLOM|nr:kinase-like domain-containing protein [Rhizophagus clarus]